MGDSPFVVHRRWLSPALGALLSVIAAFVYLTPAAPRDALDQRADAQRASYVALKERAAKAQADAEAEAIDRLLSSPTGNEPRADNPYARRGATVPTAPSPTGPATAGTAGSRSTRPGASPAAATRPPAPAAPPPAGPAAPPTCASFAWQQDAQAAYVADLSDPYGLDGAPGPNDDDGLACSLLPADPARWPSQPVGGGRAPECADFTWQQDAQAAYVANLSDPYGLDGAPGPNDDDGLACSLLASDPARPRSEPAGAAPPAPKPPAKFVVPTVDEVRAATTTFVGVSTPQAPFDWKDFQIFQAAAGGKSPNVLEFFQGWDRAYPSAGVEAAWRRGMLPMISWEPRDTVQPTGPDAYDNPSAGVQLASIVRGDFDPYLDAWAADAKAQGFPIAIRWAHEMNGNWFPWSEERNGNQRGEYVAAWRHVVDRFRAVGATNVIWVWSPNVITARPSVRLAPLYPGDDYVDWAGVVGYYRYVIAGKAATFDNTYGTTLAEIRSFTARPIFLTEIGATEVGGNKAAWMQSLFDRLPDNPDVIGFVWFDHSVNGNDWRIESSARASQIFATGVADPRYGTAWRTVF